MSGLNRQLQDYLAIRRAMGFTMERHAKLLGQFTEHLVAHHAATLTIEHALAWASAPSGRIRAGGRRGCRWSVGSPSICTRSIPPTRGPPPRGLIPPRSRRTVVPYLYTDLEIAALVRAAGEMSGPLRAATYQTLIRLLAVTGMRVGETIGLDREDVDEEAGLLTVRGAKFGKSRQLPLHPSAVVGLRDYLDLRDRLQPDPSTSALLLSTRGFRLRYQRVWEVFHRLVGLAELVPHSPRCAPRIHDLRHTFAVTTLLGWYRDGADVTALLPRLSTYLGHVDPKHTYWYLSAAPELLALAADRLAAHQQDLQ